jgi:hypothetical protein
MDNTVDIREAVITDEDSKQAFRWQTKALNLNTDEGLTITVKNALQLHYAIIP